MPSLIQKQVRNLFFATTAEKDAATTFDGDIIFVSETNSWFKNAAKTPVPAPDTFGTVMAAPVGGVTTTNGVAVAAGEDFVVFPDGSSWANEAGTVDTFGAVTAATAALTTTNGVAVAIGEQYVLFPDGSSYATEDDIDTFGTLETATAALTTTNGVVLAAGDQYILLPDGSSYAAPAGSTDISANPLNTVVDDTGALGLPLTEIRCYERPDGDAAYELDETQNTAGITDANIGFEWTPVNTATNPVTPTEVEMSVEGTSPFGIGVQYFLQMFVNGALVATSDNAVTLEGALGQVTNGVWQFSSAPAVIISGTDPNGLAQFLLANTANVTTPTPTDLVGRRSSAVSAGISEAGGQPGETPLARVTGTTLGPVQTQVFSYSDGTTTKRFASLKGVENDPELVDDVTFATWTDCGEPFGDEDTAGTVVSATAITTTNGVEVPAGVSYVEFPDGTTYAAPFADCLDIGECFECDPDERVLFLVDGSAAAAVAEVSIDQGNAVTTLPSLIRSAGSFADVDAGILYAIRRNSNQLWAYDVVSKALVQIITLTTGDGSPTSFTAAHYYDGFGYGAQFNSNVWNVYQIDFVAGTTSFHSGPWTGSNGSGTSMAINPLDGRFYLTGQAGEVYEIDGAAGASGSVGTPVYDSPNDLAAGATFDDRGNLYLTGNTEVYKIENFPNGPETQIVTGWAPGPNSMTFFVKRDQDCPYRKEVFEVDGQLFTQSIVNGVVTETTVIDLGQSVLNSGPDLMTVNAGTTAVASDNSNGEEVISAGDTLHFWSNDDSIQFNVAAGSAIVEGHINPTVLSGIAHTAITGIDLRATANANEYLVEITWTDENGVAQTTTDPTPVEINGALVDTTLAELQAATATTVDDSQVSAESLRTVLRVHEGSQTSISVGPNSGSAPASHQVAIGTNAGTDATSSDQVMIGRDSGTGTGSASQESVSIGLQSGVGLNVQGVAVGANAGNGAAGFQSVYVGYNSGQNSNGAWHSFLGIGAGESSDGDSVTALGRGALSTAVGDDNTAVGVFAGSGLTGAANVVIGRSSAANGNMSDAIAIGRFAGLDAVNGNRSVFIGPRQGSLNNGSQNVHIGYSDTNIGGGQTQSIGNDNIGIGTNAMFLNNASQVVAIGVNAGRNNTVSNTFIVGFNNLGQYAGVAAANAALPAAGADGIHLYIDTTDGTIKARL